MTPTGASLVGAFASEYTFWPSFKPILTSYGAGTKDFKDRPNLLRLVLGEEY